MAWAIFSAVRTLFADIRPIPMFKSTMISKIVYIVCRRPILTYKDGPTLKELKYQ